MTTEMALRLRFEIQIVKSQQWISLHLLQVQIFESGKKSSQHHHLSRKASLLFNCSDLHCFEVATEHALTHHCPSEQQEILHSSVSDAQQIYDCD